MNICLKKKVIDARQTWKLINSILKRDNHEPSPSIFKINNVLSRDKTEIVRAFNQYFTEIGPRLAEKVLPPLNKNAKVHFPSLQGSIAMSWTGAGIRELISGLKNSDGSGPY